MPIRAKLKCSVEQSSKLIGSVCFFSHDVGSEESVFLGFLGAGYLDPPFFRVQAWNSGCRVAKDTVMMAVPASVNERTAKVWLCFRSRTSFPPPGRYPSRARERTLAAVARKIKK